MYRTKWNSTSLPEKYCSFFKVKNFEFGKYQRIILGFSTPDSVAIFEEKFGNTFS